MNEDFVSFELANKLKEKGFRQKVNAYYGKWENLFDVHPALDMNDCDYRASAPTISQVLKWLREEKKINVNMRLLVENGWYFSIQDYMGVQRYSILQDAKDTDDLYSSYEEAAIAGITYCLDNLI